MAMRKSSPNAKLFTNALETDDNPAFRNKIAHIRESDNVEIRRDSGNVLKIDTIAEFGRRKADLRDRNYLHITGNPSNSPDLKIDDQAFTGRLYNEADRIRAFSRERRLAHEDYAKRGQMTEEEYLDLLRLSMEPAELVFPNAHKYNPNKW